MILTSRKMTVSAIRGVIASMTAPLNPSDKQLWFDTNYKPSVLKTWNASTGQWDELTVGAEISEADKQEIIESIRFGDNLLNNTNLMDGDNYWLECGGEVEGFERYITYLDEPYLDIRNPFRLHGTGNAGEAYGFKQYVNTEVGEHYIASLYYRFNTDVVAGSNNIQLTLGTIRKSINQVDNEWHRLIVEYDADTTVTEFCFGLTGEQSDVDVDFLAFQVEKSSSVTDWKLSQTDLRNSIAEHQESLGILQEAVEPQRIIETVTLSEEYKSAFANMPSYEDISNLATGEEMTTKYNTLNDYIQQVRDDADAQLSTLSSKLEKSAQDILMQFQMSTGINILRNSTGFFDTDFWDVTGSVRSVSNEELEQKAIGSAFYSKDAYTLTQEVSVTPSTAYTFSMWEKKMTAGTAKVKLMSGDTVLYEVGYASDKIQTTFDAPFIVKFITGPSQSTLKVVIENTTNTETYFSGLMLNEGEVALQWSSHNEEIANTNILFNLNGIRVKGKDGSYTVMSPDEFSGYAQVMQDNGTVTERQVFTLNADTTEVYKLNAEKSIQVGNNTIISITGSKNGLAIY